MLELKSIHVWRVELDRLTGESTRSTADFRDVLSAQEQLRANAFQREETRHNYVLTHAALRFVLGYCLGISPVEVLFAPRPSNESGGSRKPRVLTPTGAGTKHPNLRFSLSRTKGTALIGVAFGREVGVDVEWKRPIDSLGAIARSVMSDEEWMNWQALDPNNHGDAFYQLWTRKESYLKATGIGLFRSPADITMRACVTSSLAAWPSRWTVEDRQERGTWIVQDLWVSGNYAASICCEGARIPEIVEYYLDFGNPEPGKSSPITTPKA